VFVILEYRAGKESSHQKQSLEVRMGNSNSNHLFFCSFSGWTAMQGEYLRDSDSERFPVLG